MTIIEYSRESLKEYYYLVPLIPLLAWVIYYRFVTPLAKIPGPFSASLSRLWLMRRSVRGDMHQMYIDLHRQYGPVVRTGPTEVSIADPAAIKPIYGIGTKFTKSGWYAGQEVSLFAERDEKVHAHFQKLISGIYSMTSMVDFEPYIDNTIKSFMQQMRDRVGQSVDLGKWLQLLAFDVIGEITFSKPFGFVQEGNDDGSFKSLDNAFAFGVWIAQVPWLFWIIFNLKCLIWSSQGVSDDMGKVFSMATEEMNKRKKLGVVDRPDMLGKALKLQREKPAEVNDGVLNVIAGQNAIAGSDTTAITMRAIIYYLLKKPAYMARLRAEVEKNQTQGLLSNPVTFEQARKMPYLQACISEGLRMHPAVGMTLPRVVPQGGIRIHGYFLPEGTTAGISAWVVHRDEAVFGPDADTFMPERWLKGDTKEMDVSLMEMSKVLPTLLMNFDLELADPKKEWKVNCLYVYAGPFVVPAEFFVD
ncbi:hypothetical protein GP486_000943 [Trichoglossum hirsutum]|uniref:Cytochrome P450 n=1 Tax=Trichoglossum hirsutum TaxID=265104 RepID=A0A9P8LI39_9PEZI|nr:hypothetical protein GP486_000943 [Trichoglossum hirsutum]